MGRRKITIPNNVVLKNIRKKLPAIEIDDRSKRSVLGDILGKALDEDKDSKKE